MEKPDDEWDAMHREGSRGTSIWGRGAPASAPVRIHTLQFLPEKLVQ